jgi:hypothetical protein
VVDRLYDRLEGVWLSQWLRRFTERALVALFLTSLVVIEFRRQEWLPARLSAFVPSNHFYAIQVAFGALLLYEVTGLVFGLARSVANALGQQLEILSLILLRSSFEELTHFDEPIQWRRFVDTMEGNPILHLIGNAVGALVVFILVGRYYRLQRHQPISDDLTDRASFVSAKKAVAIALLVGYVIIGIQGVRHLFRGVSPFLFFEAFYTLLLFCDLLIVLISIRYTSTYRVVFRNSAFAVATILIRLALTAPSYYNALLGVIAATFAVGLTVAYNGFRS